MKKILIIVAIALFALFPSRMAAYDFVVDGIYYNANDSAGSASVTYRSTSYNSYSGDIVIPETVTNNGQTYRVTEVGTRAFYGCTELMSLIIPNTVSTIGTRALEGCTGLSSIVVEDGNEVYDSRDNCNAVVETASNTLLFGCNNTVIPNTVRVIGAYAFRNLTGLTGIEIPNSVNKIENSAFYGSGLVSIVVPNSVRTLGDYVFAYCTQLSSATLPTYLNKMGSFVFLNCSSLTGIVFPEGISMIPLATFEDCTSLASVTLPNTVTHIYGLVFAGCTSLKSITFPNSLEIIDSSSFANSGVTHLDIPNSVKTIFYGAFLGADSLRSVNLSSSLTKIDEYLFAYCVSLESITIPEGVTSIENQAFQGCTSLKKVNLSNTITTIKPRVFDDCISLTSITIPSSVTYIDGRVFADCTGLRSIICLGTTPPPASGYAFTCDTYYNIYDNAVLFVPNEAISAYRSHNLWGRFFRVVPFVGAGPGDINGDGSINITDVTNLINRLLVNDGESPAYIDVNGDGKVSINDVTALINMLLTGAN